MIYVLTYESSSQILEDDVINFCYQLKEKDPDSSVHLSCETSFDEEK